MILVIIYAVGFVVVFLGLLLYHKVDSFERWNYQTPVISRPGYYEPEGMPISFQVSLSSIFWPIVMAALTVAGIVYGTYKVIFHICCKLLSGLFSVNKWIFSGKKKLPKPIPPPIIIQGEAKNYRSSPDLSKSDGLGFLAKECECKGCSFRKIPLTQYECALRKIR